ncbi:uncharacterized protein LOC119901751 isoform X2 [Micropterus salmoides]|uniref:uncharacterized protein LOC119901751 isoform X2 n=1 Tax=Micropterus salmoides TaxID=27706 RepID=UPI0018EB9004|nr:uncharacterized protein LOC119901751 isoform X2 [Micropterus salmoides]
MGPISFLCAIFLLSSCQMQGSSAVTPVFVQKGKDVLLNITTADVPQNFFILSWRFNQKDVLVTFFPDKEPTVSNNYTGRIETDVKKYSLKLKNLQEADSGVYTARVTGSEEERILAEYNVTVQGPVSPVELSVDSASSSSDSCNLTVTCRTQDSNISSTFTCDNQTCSPEGGERSEVTTSAASLHVYLLNDSIICNHSNQVSWTEDIRKAEHFCPQHAGSSAVTPVFVQKGKDVLLNVMTADVPENFFILSWRFNQKDVLVTFFPDKEPKVSNNYTGRIETDVKKYSLKLNNLQEADNGVYTARVTGSEEERILAEYNVTVQGPVSPVELSVDSASSSSDSCNLTVTCRTQDSNISSTFTCDNQTCSQEGGERSEVTTSAASLHVYLLNDSIICNHSNQVSWTEDIRKAKHFCPQHAGSSAVTPVFVQKGKDVLLNVVTADVPQNFFILSWRFNTKVLVAYFPDKEPTVYTGRIETDVKKYSVKVKNLQEADSGVYTARVTGSEEERILAEYNVTVQGPVSPVELSVDSVSSSSDSCNLTVTCRTQDSHISSTFTCDTQTCSQEGGERSEVTTSGASLHVYLLNDSIICNHSNQVSWTKDIKKAEHFCLQHAEKQLS